MDINDHCPVHEATIEEGWQILETQCQERLGISAEVFLSRWDAGYYRDIDSSPVWACSMMIPFVRTESDAKT